MIPKELYIQLGKSDTPPAGVLTNRAQASLVNVVDPFGELDHGIGQVLSHLLKLNVAPSEIAVDLLIVAASVHIADTSVSRVDFMDGWTRQLHLHLPVSDSEKWNGATQHLEKILRFLTGDYWRFSFRPRPSKHKTLAKSPEKLDLGDYDPVALFSGGLDSLIGAIDLIASGNRPLFVSHYWDSEASSAQSQLQTELVNAYGKDAFKIIRARIGVERSDLPSAGSENTQRARSFLFYSMAAIAADALKTTNRVLIPENGLIALNVPLEPFRLGSLSTRTAHPYFIEGMEKLASLVGLSITFKNPYRFNTKGEMVKRCADQALLKKVVPLSMSCSSPAKVRWQRGTPQHCGHCVPCLIRRASLKAGLKTKDRTPYFLDDLWSKTLDSKNSEGKDIRSFLYAVDTVKRYPAKVAYLVKKPGPLPLQDLKKYAGVYKRGMEEVAEFLGSVSVSHG